MFNFKDKAVLVTGGGAGIGEAAALAFARDGACVAVNSVSSSGEKTVEKMKEEGLKALFVQGDVSSPADAQGMVEKTAEAFGKIDVVVNCAGIVCGYLGGWVDTVIMRISDLCLAFPGLVFAMGIAAVLNGGLGNAVLALAAVSWPKYARLARSQTLAVSHTDFMDAARLAGGRPLGMIRRHILPNILGPILVTAALDIGTMMMELAGLSFLGLGAMPPTAEWGSMMSNGRSMLQTYPWVVMAPGAAIFVTAAIFNLFGDALRDYLDPKNR